MACPICTAEESLSRESEAEEKVAPCIPSRPVRPPTATTASPGMIFLRTAPAGMRPTVPTKTRGL